MNESALSHEQIASNLKKVLSVNNKINSTLNIDELLGIIMTTAAEVMKAEVASLLLIDKETNELVFRVALGDKGSELLEKFRIKMGEGIAGYVAETGESVIVNDTKSDKRFAIRFDDSTGFVSKAILCVPLKAKGNIIGVIEAINPVGREEFCQSDLELFEAFAEQAAISVENARLHAEMVKQEKAKYELQIANKIQQNFLPDLSNPKFGIDIAGISIPAKDVGGDLYDVIQIDEDRVGIILGDVSGKGVPAALYMVRAISDFRFLAPQFPHPNELITKLNQGLAKETHFGMFITLTYLLVDKRLKVLEYASAGHHPIVRKRSDGTAPKELKDVGDLPLGLDDSVTYEQASISIDQGDVFFLYTDGVTEARNKNGDEFSLNRVFECLTNLGPAAKDYSSGVIDTLQKFSAGTNQHDDMTALVAII